MNETTSDHYFSAQPASRERERAVTFTIRDHEYQMTAPSGVFARHGLDKGTEVLLKKVPRDELVGSAESGDAVTAPLVVDLGCGWGPISAVLATEYPQAEVLAVDINERALQATRTNLAKLGITNVTIKEASAALAELRESGRTAQLIWSNPPIRVGKDALHQMLTEWLDVLDPQGSAYFVVQHNLGSDSLARWLTDQGYPTEKIGSQKGFRILRSRRG